MRERARAMDLFYGSMALSVEKMGDVRDVGGAFICLPGRGRRYILVRGLIANW
jgi:hypothetical protein